MRMSPGRIALCSAALVAVIAAACAIEDPGDRAEGEAAAPAATSAAASVGSGAGVSAEVTTAAPEPAPLSPADWQTVQQRTAWEVDSADRMLRRVRALTRWEQLKLRRDVNALQIARAKQLGISPTPDVDQLLKSGRLVALADTTGYWTLHNLKYSLPYVTPATETLITEIARRFQTKLDSLDAPRYRLVITSALRTPDKQAALRRANSNASRIESAHEFGTTVDIAYRRFAAPVDSAVVLGGYEKMWRDSIFANTANVRSAEMQALLGRVLAEMQQEGKVMVMMERRQTVYHITVAKQLQPLPRARATE